MEEIVKKKDALILTGANESNAKHQVFNHKNKADKKNTLFSVNPIIVFDLPRAVKIVEKPEFYTTLEALQGPFVSTKYEGGMVTWNHGKPTLLVFANRRPSPDHLSPNRLQCYMINKNDLTLERDRTFDARLEVTRARHAQRQADMEAENRSIAPPPLTDTEAIFRLCYERVASGPSIHSGQMHTRLQRRGCGVSIGLLSCALSCMQVVWRASGVACKHGLRQFRDQRIRLTQVRQASKHSESHEQVDPPFLPR